MPYNSTVKPVNLGYLLCSESIPMPNTDDNVLFCPSINQNKSEVTERAFKDYYGDGSLATDIPLAPIGYMFNDSIDGYNNYVLETDEATLNFSHKDSIQYLLSDGSVHNFAVEELEYEIGYKETIQEVCNRYNLSVPSALLHKWLQNGRIDLAEARNFLNNSQSWINTNCSFVDGVKVREAMSPFKMSRLKNQSLVCDVAYVGKPGGYEITDGGTGKPPITNPG